MRPACNPLQPISIIEPPGNINVAPGGLKIPTFSTSFSPPPAVALSSSLIDFENDEAIYDHRSQNDKPHQRPSSEQVQGRCTCFKQVINRFINVSDTTVTKFDFK